MFSNIYRKMVFNDSGINLISISFAPCLFPFMIFLLKTFLANSFITFPLLVIKGSFINVDTALWIRGDGFCDDNTNGLVLKTMPMGRGSKVVQKNAWRYIRITPNHDTYLYFFCKVHKFFYHPFELTDLKSFVTHFFVRIYIGLWTWKVFFNGHL